MKISDYETLYLKFRINKSVFCADILDKIFFKFLLCLSPILANLAKVDAAIEKFEFVRTPLKELLPKSLIIELLSKSLIEVKD